MLSVFDNLPEGLLACEAHQLYEVLPGPSLIHLPGRRQEPLLVSVLQHGNEVTGWLALRALLQKYADRELPRALSIFIGNVRAARYNQRFLDDQPDYNRIWRIPADRPATPEHAMMQRVIDEMRVRKVFASVDVHNTSGLNPHYACVNRLDHRFFHLATLFSRTVVYFIRPDTVQSLVFANLCPAVTAECGQPGHEHGTAHAMEYLEACLHLSEIPTHPVAPRDIDLFHTVAIAKVPDEISFGFGDDNCDIRFLEDIDHLNFRELPVNTTLGWVRPDSNAYLEVRDEHGREVAERFFNFTNGEIRTVLPVMPSMLTVSATAIRQDCLCYLMERHRGFYEQALKTA